MASEISQAMESLREQLKAAYPLRVVSRDLQDFDHRSEDELLRGVYTLVAGSEDGFPNYNGREGNFGTLHPVIVGQLLLDERDQPSPSQVEDAEGLMIDEIKAFTRSQLAAPIDSLVITSIRRSQQLDCPYGWVSFDMEMMLS